MAYEDFTEMPAWKAGFNLLLDIYKISQSYPADERFGLTSDTRRSTNSIVHNIAEGFGRFEAKDKTRFNKISRGSAYELTSQILVAQALSYTSETVKNELIQQCRRIISDLNSLFKTLEKG